MQVGHEVCGGLDVHRFLLQEFLDHLRFVESKMQRIEQEIEERLGPF